MRKTWTTVGWVLWLSACGPSAGLRDVAVEDPTEAPTPNGTDPSVVTSTPAPAVTPTPTTPPTPPAPPKPFTPAWPPLQKSIPHWAISFGDATAAIVYDMSRGREYAPGHFQTETQAWDVELRQRGDSARYQPKLSWKVKLPEGQLLHGQRKLNFLAEWLDAGYLTDMFAYRLMQASGVLASNVEYVTLSVNGKAEGIFTQVEQVDSHFLKQHGMDEDGNVYRCGARDCELKIWPRAPYQDDWEKKTNESSPSGDLDAFLKALSRVPEHQLEAWLERHMNLEGHLRYMAVNALISNIGIDDSGSYLIHDLQEDRWRYAPWDLNNSYMLFWRTEALDAKPFVSRSVAVYTVYDEQTYKTYEWKEGKYGNAHRPFSVLDQRIWDRPALRQRILAHIQKLMTTVFSPEQANPQIDALYALLKPEFPKDPYVDRPHADRAPGHLKDYVRGRIAYLKTALAKEAKRGEGGVVIQRIQPQGGIDDKGEPSGFVELYNRESTSKALDGMVFTDELRREFKYRLPAGLVVPAHGTLTLWADGQTTQGSSHLPFILSSEGGEVGLFDGKTMAGAIDVAYFPPLPANQSYERFPVGTEDWRFGNTP